jgi:cyanophycinase-like exopeptidase
MESRANSNKAKAAAMVSAAGLYQAGYGQTRFIGVFIDCRLYESCDATTIIPRI